MARLLVVVALVAVCVVGASARRWDIQPGLISKAMKDAGHESITEKALDSVLTEKPNTYMRSSQLRKGVEYNDMPANDAEDTIGTASFLSKFLAAEHLSSDNSLTKTATGRSHVGCNQHWHAMCPVATDKNGDVILFANEDVQVLISNQLNDWYMDALDRLYRSFKCKDGTGSCTDRIHKDTVKEIGEQRGTLGQLASQVDSAGMTVSAAMKQASARVKTFFGKSVEDSDFRIGHIIHTVQDSFADGHTVRDKSNGPCGNIVLFQGYTMQMHNDRHGDADHVPESKHDKKAGSVNVARRKELYQCSIDSSREFLAHWSDCKTALVDFIKTQPASYTESPDLLSFLDHLQKVRAKAHAPSQEVVNKCNFPHDWFRRTFALKPSEASSQCGGATARSSMFWRPATGKKCSDKTPCNLDVARQNAAALNSGVDERQVTVHLGAANAPQFEDCNGNTLESGSVVGADHCVMSIFQPRLDAPKGAGNRNYRPTPGLGRRTTKEGTRAIDWSFLTPEAKEAYCDNQMKKHDIEFYKNVVERRKRWTMAWKRLTIV